MDTKFDEKLELLEKTQRISDEVNPSFSDSQEHETLYSS